MKTTLIRNALLLTLPLLLFIQCQDKTEKTRAGKTKNKIELQDYSSIYKVKTGRPVSVLLTAYSTTLIADGKDQTMLNVALNDSLSRQITSADDSIRIYLIGDGKFTDIHGIELRMKTDTSGERYAACKLKNGSFALNYIAGTNPGHTKLEARCKKLWPGGHELHLLNADFEYMKPGAAQIPPTTIEIPRMVGADISFLPQLENERGRVFTEDGQEIDAIQLLKKHGFNAIRLRIFVNPENEKGYSPGKGYCGLDNTLEMARRVKQAGMLFLLDFHYSDYWADPQQQYKPEAWQDLDFEALKIKIESYTSSVLMAMNKHGLMPDMVQIGNEINHGLLWPDGHIGNPDQLAELLKAGSQGVKSVDPQIPVMMHIALGGQNDEAVFWLDNMIARDVAFDIIGLSYYPRWHGTLNDLNTNMRDLIKRYNKPLNVVEYGDFKQEVHDIVFDLPDDMGKGACIWEPLGPRSGLFTREGEVTGLMHVYDSLAISYLQ